MRRCRAIWTAFAVSVCAPASAAQLRFRGTGTQKSKFPSFTPLFKPLSHPVPLNGARSQVAGAPDFEGSAAPGVRVSSRQFKALGINLLGNTRKIKPKLGAGHTDAPVAVSSLRDYFRTEYMGRVGVGTTSGKPQAELKVIYDTGSADLWFSSDLCRKYPCGSDSRGLYNHSMSETYKPGEDTEFRTSYGSGVIKGRVGFDDVRIGPIASTQQKFGMISEEEGDAFVVLPIEGIVGLGFPALSDDPKMSLIGNLLAQESLPRQQFAFYLHPDASKGGGVLWGGVDERLFEGDLDWFPTTEQVYWSLDLVSFEVGNFAYGKYEKFTDDDKKPRLIIDSGTTFYTAEGAVYEAIARRIKPCECSRISTLPPLVYTIRNILGKEIKISIPPEEYMIADGGQQTNKAMCLPGIANIGSVADRPMMILGEVFMRHYFTVFDFSGANVPAHSDGPISGKNRLHHAPVIGLSRAKIGNSADAFLQETMGPSTGVLESA